MANETQNALLDEIRRQVSAIDGARYSEVNQAKVVANLALAYRYTVGGPQPGNVVVEQS